MNNKRKVVVKEVPVYEVEEIPEDMTEEIEASNHSTKI